MPQPAADHNLLFGILALQMDFISREQLITAMQGWVFDKTKSLGEILQSQKALAEDTRVLLDALVRKHLVQHGDDVEKSLAAVSAAVDVRTDLERIADLDVQASLAHVPASAADMYATLDVQANLAHVPAHAADRYATIAPSQSTARPTTGMRFRIVRPHAKGGLGEVFVARDEELNREVALKEILERQADHKDSRDRFMIEAEITGGLEHPGIVPVYGLGVYPDGRPYYAMRFIRGDSLKDAIDQFHKADPASLNSGQRVVILRSLLRRFLEVCDAISYAHSRGMIHRDLKPANVMLGKYGETIVVDWGLAKVLGEPAQGAIATNAGEGSLIPASLSSASETIAGAAVGTPQFMSPEQAAGRLDLLGPASDIYSLGATLFCVLTGKSPIGNSDVGTILRKVQRGEILRAREVKSDVPAPLEAVCMKAMALNPADRYASPRELADDLEHWLADEPVTAWPEPWTVRTRRWIGRHATMVTGAASAVLVTLVGLIVVNFLLTAANDRERKAKDRERVAKEHAQEQEKEVRKQKEKVEENYLLARRAVDRYFISVSEQRLLNEPGMQPLRKELLETAARYYAKFLKVHAGNPTYQGELGTATLRLALITADIDSKPKAIKLLEEAAELFQTLPTNEANLDYKSELAACYHHLGRVYRQLRKADKAEEFYGKAIGVWEQLLQHNAKEEHFRVGLSRSQLGLGNVYQDNRQLPEAEKIYAAALAARQALVEAHPEVALYQRELATSHNNRAVLFKSIGKDAAAEYQAALKIQKQLADAHPYISQYQDDLARTHFNLGDLQTQGGPAHGDEAAGYEEAARIWKALMERHPTHTDFHKMLAETYAAIARAYRETANAKKADEAALQAVATQRKLVLVQKDDLAFESNLAGGLFALGEVGRSHHHGKEAEAAYLEAIQILEKLSAKAPDLRARQAQALNGLGLLYYQESKTDKAFEVYHKAKTIWEQLVAAYPNEVDFAVGLSTTFSNLGNLTLFVGKPMEAQPLYTQALAMLDASKVKTPNSASVKEALRDAHMGRAKALTALKNHADALADWNRAIALTQEKDRPLLQLPRAATLARAGKHVEATKEAALLLPLVKTPGAMYSFACVYSLAVAAVEADTKLPASERQKLAADYTAASVKLLSGAHAAGLFKSPEDRRKLAVDPDLEAVRSRPEFKKLVSEIKTP